MIIRKSFRAEMSHRLVHAYTQHCLGLHGHSYIFEIFLEGTSQNEAQMLLDFSMLSDKFRPFLDAFDHSLIVWKEDEELCEMAPRLNPRYIIVPYNPTSEQMSRHIYYQGLKLDLPMSKVVVHETSNCCAEFRGDDSIEFDLDEVIFSEALKSGLC